MTEEAAQPSRMDAAIDSHLAKFVARFLTPMLLLALCFFVRGALVNQDTQGKDIVQIKSDLRDLNTRLDAGVIARVNQNSSRIEDHEQRLQRLERAARMP